jgi:hypothetical protein
MGDWAKAHDSAQQDEGAEDSWCMPTCIARKAIRATQPIGIAGRAGLFAENHSMRSGSTSWEPCSDKTTLLGVSNGVPEPSNGAIVQATIKLGE